MEVFLDKTLELRLVIIYASASVCVRHKKAHPIFFPEYKKMEKTSKVPCKCVLGRVSVAFGIQVLFSNLHNHSEEHAHIHTQANMCVAERIEKDFYLCLFLLLGYLFKIFTLTLLL